MSNLENLPEIENCRREVNRVAVSSRCRLARNLADFPFPNRATREEKVKISNTINSSVKENEFFKEYTWLELSGLTNLQKSGFLEENLISASFSTDIALGRALCHNADRTRSFMINEEDHLRIQVKSKGLDLKNCYRSINRIDDELESKSEFAFSGEFGYKTACPSNMGTGLRASVMLHLPATFITGNLDALTQYTSQLGLVIRGIHGEGTQAMGNTIQLSNQDNGGLSEEQVVERMEQVTRQIIDRELNARDALLMESKDRISDSVHRDLAILRSARLLGLGEFLDMLSTVRMGVEMGILPEIPEEVLDGLLVSAMPAHLQLKIGCSEQAEVVDRKRAELVRETLKPYTST